MPFIPAPNQMSGKICLVTGASSGLGAATALALARLGATVLAVGRNPARTEAAARAMRRRSGSACIEVACADLSIRAEIERLAREVRSRYGRLDVLVNNAGARFLTRQLSADGLEMTLALNHLGYFTLTNLLLEELLAGSPGRVINVASDAHRLCSAIDFENLQGERVYRGKEAYAQSKLANLLFTYELARQLDGTGLTVNALHPGNVLTGFSRNNGWSSWFRHIAGSLLSGELVLPAAGARTGVYLATAPELAGVTGKYFVQGRLVASSEASYDREAARRLWEVSLELTRLQAGKPGWR